MVIRDCPGTSGPSKRAASSAMIVARCRPPGPTVSCSHFAVVSHRVPRASESCAAATAEGARPTTPPVLAGRSGSRSQVPLIAFKVVVFPEPAGPTRTCRPRPDEHTWTSAPAWSADRALIPRAVSDRGGPSGEVTAAATRSAKPSRTAGPAPVVAAFNSRVSASSTVGVVQRRVMIAHLSSGRRSAFSGLAWSG